MVVPVAAASVNIGKAKELVVIRHKKHNVIALFISTFLFFILQ
jgi:hypothetical protein